MEDDALLNGAASLQSSVPKTQHLHCVKLRPPVVHTYTQKMLHEMLKIAHSYIYIYIFFLHVDISHPSL